MLHTRLGIEYTKRYDDNGGVTLGYEFVGEDHVVRWFSLDEIAAMKGAGRYSGEWGYNVYDDAAHPVSHEV